MSIRYIDGHKDVGLGYKSILRGWVTRLMWEKAQVVTEHTEQLAKWALGDPKQKGADWTSVYEKAGGDVLKQSEIGYNKWLKKMNGDLLTPQMDSLKTVLFSNLE